MLGQFRCQFSALILPGCLVAFSWLASADVFNVNGTFGTDIFRGPLNGGSFVGTFTATLPITTGFEPIPTYDIDLLTSSDTVLTTLTDITGTGDCFAIPTPTGACVEVTIRPPVGAGCNTGSSVDLTCDLFIFGGSDRSFLTLATPLNFTGGPVFPLNTFLRGVHGSFASFQVNTRATDSAVNSGSIQPIPEPTARLLLAAVLLGGFWINRRRPGRQRV
jgi:hypothetical protein